MHGPAVRSVVWRFREHEVLSPRARAPATVHSPRYLYNRPENPLSPARLRMGPGRTAGSVPRRLAFPLRHPGTGACSDVLGRPPAHGYCAASFAKHSATSLAYSECTPSTIQFHLLLFSHLSPIFFLFFPPLLPCQHPCLSFLLLPFTLEEEGVLPVSFPR